MCSKHFIAKVTNTRREIFYMGMRLEVEFQLKVTAVRDGRLFLASAKPIRIKVDGREFNLEAE